MPPRDSTRTAGRGYGQVAAGTLDGEQVPAPDGSTPRRRQNPATDHDITQTLAAPASATSIIGFLNGVYNNTCINHGSSGAQAGVAEEPGTTSGAGLSVPISTPVNQCGDLGLPTGEVARTPVTAPVEQAEAPIFGLS